MRYNEKTREGGNKILGVLPIFHVYRVTCEMLLPPWMGITSVMSPCFEKLDFYDAIEQHNITMVYIVPPIALGLLRNEHILKQNFGAGWGARLRICCCAAAPLGKELIENLWNRFGWRTIQAYGLSKCSPAHTQQHLGDFLDSKETVSTLVNRV